VTKTPDTQTPRNDASNSEAHETDTERRAKRRALLTAISSASVLGASKLPNQWARPVVDHVLLPVHAAGSPAAADTLGCEISCTVTELFAGSIYSDSDPTVLIADDRISFTCFRLPAGSLASSFSDSIGGTVSFFGVTDATNTIITESSISSSSALAQSACETPLSDVPPPPLGFLLT